VGDGALIAEEEEQLVLLHRTAHGPAKLVPLEPIVQARGEVGTIQTAIAEELERVAMETVSA
jgi:hypothetical protein